MKGLILIFEWLQGGSRINAAPDTQQDHQSVSDTNMKLSASALALLAISCLPASLRATPESVEFEEEFYKAMYQDQNQGEASNKSPPVQRD